MAGLNLDELVAAKGASGTTVSLCLPTKDEEATVGTIVARVVAELVEANPLVDEVLVVDDHSRDTTSEVAADAGARVVAVDDVLSECGPGSGKGEAMWKSLAASSGDLVVWCDADLVDFETTFVTGLLAPLLLNPAIHFVKARYSRWSDSGAMDGGRVTELCARPLIDSVLPELSGFAQPLAGEYAGRRWLLEGLPFAPGYGVDIGLLADVAATVGVGAMAEVDLGTRRHRNRPLGELTGQARDVMATGLARAGINVAAGASLPDRPALVTVAGYRGIAG